MSAPIPGAAAGSKASAVAQPKGATARTTFPSGGAAGFLPSQAWDFVQANVPLRLLGPSENERRAGSRGSNPRRAPEVRR